MSTLKKFIKSNLTKELSKSEIIISKNRSIWVIDREEKYWYLELEKTGHLWWRWEFFSKFFKFFSMERSEFESIINEWVEDLLNSKVVSSMSAFNDCRGGVEDLLNSKVVSSEGRSSGFLLPVEDLLNSKVVSSGKAYKDNSQKVEDLLKLKSSTPLGEDLWRYYESGEVLDEKNITSSDPRYVIKSRIYEVLNGEK